MDVSAKNDNVALGCSYATNSLDDTQTKLEETSEQAKEIQQGLDYNQQVELINMQVAIGQYSAMIECNTSIIKSFNDSMKSIASKI